MSAPQHSDKFRGIWRHSELIRPGVQRYEHSGWASVQYCCYPRRCLKPSPVAVRGSTVAPSRPRACLTDGQSCTYCGWCLCQSSSSVPCGGSGRGAACLSLQDVPPVCSCCPLVSRPTRDRGWFSVLLTTLGLITCHRPDSVQWCSTDNSIRRRLRPPCRKCLIVQSHRPTFIHAQNV